MGKRQVLGLNWRVVWAIMFWYHAKHSDSSDCRWGDKDIAPSPLAHTSLLLVLLSTCACKMKRTIVFIIFFYFIIPPIVINTCTVKKGIRDIL